MDTRLANAWQRLRGAAPEPTTVRKTVLPSGHTLTLRHGDITGEAIDAIVNAANTGLMHGGGVAGAIVRRGGDSIQEESNRLGTVPTGSAAITGAGKLPCRYVIHAVGPVWGSKSPEASDDLLASATTAALEIARERGFTTIAFPAISSGIFGFPKHRCAQVMLRAIRTWAESHPTDNPRDLRITIIDQETLDFFRTEWDTE